MAYGFAAGGKAYRIEGGVVVFVLFVIIYLATR